MLTETTDYDELYRNFRWNIPARFNMASRAATVTPTAADGWR